MALLVAALLTMIELADWPMRFANASRELNQFSIHLAPQTLASHSKAKVSRPRLSSDASNPPVSLLTE